MINLILGLLVEGTKRGLFRGDYAGGSGMDYAYRCLSESYLKKVLCIRKVADVDNFLTVRHDALQRLLVCIIKVASKHYKSCRRHYKSCRT